MLNHLFTTFLQVKKTTFDIELDKNELRACTGDPDSLMSKTFAARRRAIVCGHAPISELKEDYPQLFTEKQASFASLISHDNFC